MNRSHLHTVSSWLNDLTDLTAGSAPLADSKRGETDSALPA